MSLYLPREPKPGQPVRASDLIALIRYVKSITPRESPDILINFGTDGYVPKLKNRAPAGRGYPPIAPPPFPFEEIPAPYTGMPASNQALIVAFRKGYVNNRFPTNMTATFTLDPSTTTEFWLHATINWTGGTPTITELLIEKGDTIPADDTASQPLNVYCGIVEIVTGLTSVSSVNQFVSSVLNLNFLVGNFDCLTRVSTAVWSPV